ncbi:type 2 lanthipeptide synthetase LanM family protein [Longispora sp. K20-0274]|uniref:type 2 lanthipeptide synthetase LanM family protein n=1 Tax=Longispora sp. K20-0274 TaxID=3088255 RepID=UPI00399AFC29
MDGDGRAGTERCWWARGLTLTERPTPAPGRVVAGDADRAARRLARWRTVFPTGEAFGARLAAAGIDENVLALLLAEDATSLAGRVDRPDWAGFAERAAQLARPPTGREFTWEDGFGAIVGPFAELAARELLAAEPGLRDLRAGFTAQTRGLLTRLARRTLVLELNVYRVSGRLDGAMPRDRFASFVRQLCTREGLTALIEEYAVLARLLAQACLQNVTAWVELYGRFTRDRPAIVADLLGAVEPGPLVEIASGAGDRHRGGRSVAVLRFADGARVVYKPRPVTAHALFNCAVRWLNARMPGPALPTLALLSRPSHGWVEFAAHAPCRDRDGVDRFYRRQGATLALLHALDATDIHHENLVARGDEPVLVDLETLLHPTLPVPGPRATDPAARAMDSSVYRTALLSLPVVGDHGMIDLSGLGADKGALSPLDGVGWGAPGTDEMRLVRRQETFEGSDNRPRLDGRDADPAAYTASLLSGFRDAYQAIASGRAELVGPDGPLAASGGADLRVVVRPTRVYATLLDESTHPDVLRDALDRDRLLDTLWADSTGAALWWQVAGAEIAGLWAGDIPLFDTRSDSLALASGGFTLDGALDATGVRRVSAKLAALGGPDQYDQEWIIQAALATRAPLPEHRPGRSGAHPHATTVPDRDRLLASACGIADQLVAMAFEDDHHANWLGLEPVDDRHWMVLPQGAGLAHGYCGTALLLAQLAGITGTARYARLARRAVCPIPNLLDHLARHPEQAAAVGCGGFAGFGGIAYALSHLAALLDDGEVAGWVPGAVRLVAGAAHGSGPGVLTGAAGGVAAMLAVHATTGSDLAWDAARTCADAVLAADPAGLPAGFGTGLAGMGWALARFGASGGGTRYADAGRALLAASRPAADDPSWCHGLPGLALALADLGDTPAGGTVDRAVGAVAARPPLDDHSLCHGELGGLELLVEAAAGGHHAARAGRIPRAGLLLAALDRVGPQCATPGLVPSPGLLTGLAGIGYGLLRLGFPDRTPSVLLLRPPHAPATRPGAVSLRQGAT